MTLRVPLFVTEQAKTMMPAPAVDAQLYDAFDLVKFVENFDGMTAAPGGVDAFRRLVVDLAIRGRLAMQHKAEGTGVELVAELSGQQRLFSRRARSVKQIDELQVDSAPFTIPGTWAWSTMGEITVKLGAGSTPLGGKSVYKASGIKFLRSQNVWNDGLRLSDVAYIAPETHAAMSGTHIAPGDILLNITGASIGRTSVVPDTFDAGNVSQHVAIVRLADKAIRRFVHLAMTATYFQDAIMSVQVGVSREGLSMKKLQHLPVPVPPLGEQKRIVARVDQLMALIDDLEAKQTKKRDLSTRFTKASLEALTTVESAEDFDNAWRGVVENFSTILDASTKVGELRRAILVLAARGLLVRQEPSDSPAEALVAQCPIRQKKAEAEGRFKRVERLPPPRDDERGEFPPAWACERLGNLCRFIDYRGKTPTKLSAGTRLITAKNVRMGFVNLEPQEFIAPEDYPRWMTRGLPAAGDLLFTTEAPLGNVALFEFSEPVALAQRIIALHPYCDIDSRFLMFVLISPWFQTLLANKATGMTAAGIKASKLKELVVPIAPLVEQKRIVAKVDQLMKLCDDLEAELRRAEDRASKLVEAVVQEMVV